MRRVLAAGIAAAMVMLTGCGAFFVCQKASCPATSSTSSTSSTVKNYAYVSNSASGANYINGYSLAGATLTTSTTGSPYSLGYTPIAMAVNPANTFLYAAVDAALSSSIGNVGIYAYAIGTGGALTIANNGTPVAAASNYTAIGISSDGNWLFALDTLGVLYEYGINASTGALTAQNSIGVIGSNGGTALAVQVAPSGNFVVATLGTGGDVICPFNTTSGALTTTCTQISLASGVGDYAVTVDANNDIYFARTTGLAVYTATSAGAVGAGTLYAAGTGPHSVAVLGTANVYVGNQNLANSNGGTISGYTETTGPVLTAFSSTLAGPNAVSSLSVDKSGTYLLAAGYNAATGLQLYTVGSNGALTATGSAATGTTTTVPVVMALTH